MINNQQSVPFFQQQGQPQYNVIPQRVPQIPIQQPQQVNTTNIQYQPQFPQPPKVSYQPQIIQTNNTQNILPTVYQEKAQQVISIDEIEAPWRLKCATLERQILELQIQLRKGVGPTEPDAIEVIDDTRLRELEAKKNQLSQMIEDRDHEIRELEDQIHQQQESIEIQIQERTTHYSNEIETWLKRYQQLERDYNNSQQQLQDLQEEQRRLEKQNNDNRQQQSQFGAARNY